ncbi:hypothetical protein [Streptomyces sp. NPDC056660]|uniref:hypothetical protein n=1 Tax=Streptomyces sp. NPDC056660 TaxID=3345897 RepID=UPI0036A64E58
MRGFQHGFGGIGPESVVCVVKHFADHGAQVNGFDSHFLYGKDASFHGHNFPAQEPFRAAVHQAGVGSVMTMYSIAQQVTLFGRPLEQVGAAFNRQLASPRACFISRSGPVGPPQPCPVAVPYGARRGFAGFLGESLADSLR